MRLFTLLTIMLLVAAFGCAPGIKFYPIPALENESLSSREVPAKVTEESEGSLEKKGYLYIGAIGKSETLQTCWGADCDTSFNCPEKLLQNDFTPGIAEKAASYGGDLVVWDQGKQTAESTFKQGNCIKRSAPYAKTEQDLVAHPIRGYILKDRTYVASDCIDWEWMRGKACKVYSGGKVWRKESPEFIESIKRKSKLVKIKSMKKEFEDNNLTALKNRGSIMGPVAKKVGDKYGIIETVWSDKFIVAPQYTDALAGSFSEGLQAVAVGEGDKKLWGFIDTAGKWVIRPSYSDASKFYEDCASVKINNKYGYINKEGKFIIKPQFDKATWFAEGLARVTIDAKEGYVNKAGEIFMEP